MPELSTTRFGPSNRANRADVNSPASGVLYDGSGLNVDFPSFVAQHDVVYLAPALDGSQGMPLGDGDLGAMFWCPERLLFQLHKTDLWADPEDGADRTAWQQVSAGAVSIESEPAILHEATRYDQRLRLHSGIVTIDAENEHGTCKVTTFVSASTGVLVVHYRDQRVRCAERRVDVTLERDAHLFALGETVGILQALRDRRYALLARVAGARVRPRTDGDHRCSLVLESARSSSFTLYVAVATSPKDGDPVARARQRLESAVYRGFDRLLSEQREHWSRFWEKSFLRLQGPADDSLPGYLENLWYLGLYQQACCSRGFDAPLTNGGLWPSGERARGGPAIYSGPDLRAMIANLVRSNHLELSVPYVDTYFRLLPEFAARTACDLGVGGARFPSAFNRLGEDLQEVTLHTDGRLPGQLEAERQLISEGIETGLLVWEAWRHAPDPYFLRERAYPLLRAGAVFAIERCEAIEELRDDPEVRSGIATALRALLWADAEFDLNDELRPAWQLLLEHLLPAGRFCSAELQPLGSPKPAVTGALFRSLLAATPHQPCGLFGHDPRSPDLAGAARLCTGMTAMLLGDRSLPIADGPGEIRPAAGEHGFGGSPPAAIDLFPGLPEAWSAAFSLTAPGGFRIGAEADQGVARYVAITSLLGGICQIVNPWGAGERACILVGRRLLFHSSARVLEFMTEPHTTYLIERQDARISRATTVRLGGRPNSTPLQWDAFRLGIPAAVGVFPPPEPDGRRFSRESAAAVSSGHSRVDRARARHEAAGMP